MVIPPRRRLAAVARSFRPRLEVLEGRSVPAGGALDPTFGTGGTVNFNFALTDRGHAAALQADGKIVVAGSTSNGGTDQNFAVARFLPDGAIDPTFGTNGRVTTDFAGRSDEAFAVEVQADGKIVVAGLASDGFGVARYLPNGTLDPSFGTGGRVTTTVLLASTAFDLVIQPDGKIVASGNAQPTIGSSTTHFALARYNADGTLDSGFGTGGVVTTNVGLGHAAAEALVLQPDGKIVAGGGTDATSTGSKFVLARYLPGGALDPTFNGSGTAITPFSGGSFGQVRGLGVQSDGKIVAGGVHLNAASNADVSIARYLPNGLLDPTFDLDGQRMIDLGGTNDAANAVAVQPDGRIVLAGTKGVPGGSHALTVRLNTDGSSDLSFGTGGVVTTDLQAGANDDLNEILFQPGGKIVVVGTINSGSDSNMGLARYLPGGSILVAPRAGQTTEAGAAITFSAVLSAVPTADVTVPLSHLFPHEGTLSAASLTFTPANALVPQTVTVRGVNDGEVDGPIAYTVATGAATSADLNFNGLNPADVAVTNLDNDPIRVEGVVINNSADQRSMVKGIAVTFSQAVELAAGAFVVRRADNSTFTPTVTPTTVDGKTVALLTFAGTDIEGGSLPDGRYTLTVNDMLVTDSFGQRLDGDGDGAPGGPHATAFHRLFGDGDGDTDVDNLDLLRLRSSFNLNSGQPGFLAHYDYEGDTDVDNLDLLRLRQRFST